MGTRTGAGGPRHGASGTIPNASHGMLEMDRPRPIWPWLLVFGLLITGGLAYLFFRFPGSVATNEEQADLFRSVLVLLLVASGAVVHWRLRPGQALKNALAWIAIAGVLFIGYAFRHEAQAFKDRLWGELVPSGGIVEAGAIRFSAGRDGHFTVEAEINKERVRFLVDTGASDVVLSPADATRLGIDLNTLAFNRRYSTANGIGFGAPVVLARITVGPISIDNVRASVNREPMSRSLLGMSFLSRLSGYEVSRDTLILKR